MPNNGNYLKATGDWEQLLAAVQEHQAILPDLTTEKDTLQQLLQAANEMKLRKESYRAARQQSTQDLNDLLRQGNEVAMQIRSAAKFKIGARNERLVHFNIAPLRSRSRRAAVLKKPETPASPPALLTE